MEELVVGGQARQRPRVRRQAGDDRGRVGEAALGQADNAMLAPLVVVVVMTARAGPTGVEACLDRDDVRGDRPD